MRLTVRAAILLIRFVFAQYLIVAIYSACSRSGKEFLADFLSLSSHFLTIFPTYSNRCRLHCLCNMLNVRVGVGFPWYICSPAIASLHLACLCIFKSVSCCRGYIASSSFQSFTICAFIFSSAYLVQFALAWPTSCVIQHHERGISLIFSPYAESFPYSVRPSRAV